MLAFKQCIVSFSMKIVSDPSRVVKVLVSLSCSLWLGQKTKTPILAKVGLAKVGHPNFGQSRSQRDPTQRCQAKGGAEGLDDSWLSNRFFHRDAQEKQARDGGNFLIRTWVEKVKVGHKKQELYNVEELACTIGLKDVAGARKATHGCKSDNDEGWGRRGGGTTD